MNVNMLLTKLYNLVHFHYARWLAVYSLLSVKSDSPSIAYLHMGPHGYLCNEHCIDSKPVAARHVKLSLASTQGPP